jgi:hypothetical protein
VLYVEDAQTQLDWVREVRDRGEEQLRAIDEHLQNMIDATPEGPVELVEAYQRGLDTIRNLKQSTQTYMTKVAKDLLKAERALKKAKGELKVTFPEDSVAPEQGSPSRHDGADNDEETTKPDQLTEPDQPTETDQPTESDEPAETGEPTETNEEINGDEPTETEGNADGDEPTDNGESIDIDILPPGTGIPFVLPGVVPPVIIPIPRIGDILAPTRVVQKLAKE